MGAGYLFMKHAPLSLSPTSLKFEQLLHNDSLTPVDVITVTTIHKFYSYMVDHLAIWDVGHDNLDSSHGQ
jgi:hypothetical protein